MAVEPLLGQFPLHDVLGGDAGVVGAGQPQGGIALHPLAADRGVDERVLEGVAHVERAGDVGRRDHDAERLAALVASGRNDPASSQTAYQRPSTGSGS